MRKVLHEPNRWEVHSAEEVAVTLDDLRLRILQQARGCVHGRCHSSKDCHRSSNIMLCMAAAQCSTSVEASPLQHLKRPFLSSPLQPHQLAGAGVNPDKLGVAAALWDGALVLAAYLVAQPRYRYLGGWLAGTLIPAGEEGARHCWGCVEGWPRSCVWWALGIARRPPNPCASLSTSNRALPPSFVQA